MIISPKIKKSISYFFTICMCTGLLTGLCGCGSDVDGQTQDMLTPSVTVTAEDMVSSVSLPVGGLEGVVDDNYRNFYE